MSERGFLTIAQQVAAHLREELRRGRWTGEMPGRHEVAAELGVSDQTAETGLAQLEKEGILVPQGAGRRRRIELPAGAMVTPSLRVAILVGEPADRRRDYLVQIKHELAEAGHAPFFTLWCMPELGMNVRSIEGRLKRTEADVWIVLSAARPLLEWFVEQEVPVFALFGRRRGLPVAGVGPDKPPAIAEATRRLIALGHRRIVFLTLRAQRLPQPGASVQPFLDELVAHGIAPGPYNLPDWDESIDSLHGCLEALFKHSPPTALIVDEAAFFVATMQFLMNRRLRMPEDVSLICTDGDPHFAWCRPPIAHIRWDTAPVVRRALRWTANLAHGKRDVRQTLTKAEFVEGGTIGPVSMAR
jgi:DNA-binding LacI/PurR family transcriptional regulator